MPSINRNAATSGSAWMSGSLGPASSQGDRRNLGNTPRQSSSNPFLDNLSHIGGQRPPGASIRNGKGKEKQRAEAKAEDLPPPRYDEIYKNNGEFVGPSGKPMLLTTDGARKAHMKNYGMNSDFIHPTAEEAGAIYNKKPIFVIDTSGSMNLYASRNEKKITIKQVKFLGLIKTGKTKTKEETVEVQEARWMEQARNTKRLMRMTEAYSGEYPSLWDLAGHHLEGPEVSSVSPAVEAALREIGGLTPLSATLKNIKAYEQNSGNTTDLAIYISTDGDPTDAGTDVDKSFSRLIFEETVRDLTTNGIIVEKDGKPHTRKVGVSVQYIGDDETSFTFKDTYYENGRELSLRTDRDAYYAARLADVRKHGSTAAWLSALDDDRKGGIPRFDVVDDDEAEIADVKQKTGKTISKEDLDLKRAVGMWVSRLDRADEEASDRE